MNMPNNDNNNMNINISSTIPPSIPKNTSWRHQFRTPKKGKLRINRLWKKQEEAATSTAKEAPKHDEQKHDGQRHRQHFDQPRSRSRSRGGNENVNDRNDLSIGEGAKVNSNGERQSTTATGIEPPLPTHISSIPSIPVKEKERKKPKKKKSKVKLKSESSRDTNMNMNLKMKMKMNIHRDSYISSDDFSSLRCNENKIEIEPIKYGLMRSIVTALSYIEQNGGLVENKDLYVSSKCAIDTIHTININSINTINTINANDDNDDRDNNRGNRDSINQKNFQQQVRACMDLMLKGEAQQVELFDSKNLLSSSSSSSPSTSTLSKTPPASAAARYYNVTVVAMATLGVLKCSPPLLPKSICTKLMNITSGHECEVEELLSSPSIPDVNSMTVIILLHHLAKLYKVRVRVRLRGQGEEKEKGFMYMKKVAEIFGLILLRKNDHHDVIKKSSSSSLSRKTTGRSLFFGRREKVDGDGNGDGDGDGDYNGQKEQEVMMLIMVHMSKDHSVVVKSAPETETISNRIEEEEGIQFDNYDDCDGYDDYNCSRSEKEISDQNQYGKRLSLGLNACNADEIQVQGSETNIKNKRHEMRKMLMCPQDDVGINCDEISHDAIEIASLYHDDDHTMRRAKQRLESAEMILERIENRTCTSLTNEL